MQTIDIFYLCVLIAGLWGVLSAMVMVSSRKGIKVNWFLIKILIIKYIRQYYDITTKETGKPGWWFYSYLVSMNVALGVALLGIILSRLL